MRQAEMRTPSSERSIRCMFNESKPKPAHRKLHRRQKHEGVLRTPLPPPRNQLQHFHNTTIAVTTCTSTGVDLTTTPPQQTHQHLHHLATTRTPTPDTKPLFRKKDRPLTARATKPPHRDHKQWMMSLAPWFQSCFSDCAMQFLPPLSPEKEVPFS